jgi:hypothetical protein
MASQGSHTDVWLGNRLTERGVRMPEAKNLSGVAVLVVVHDDDESNLYKVFLGKSPRARHPA